MVKTDFTSGASWPTVQPALPAPQKLFSEMFQYHQHGEVMHVVKRKVALGGTATLHFVLRFVCAFKFALHFLLVLLKALRKYLLTDVDIPVQVMLKSFPI